MQVAFAVVLAMNSPRTAHAAFPGNSGKIAFTRCPTTYASSSYPCDVYVMNASLERPGNQPRLLTSSPDLDSESAMPAFSPGGYSIAVVGGNGRDIWKVNYDGTGLTNLTHNSSNCKLAAPAYSPDGSRIAFEEDPGSCHGNDEGIYVMNSDGSGRRRLADAHDNQITDYYSWSHLVWSPTGSRIAYQGESRSAGGTTVLDTIWDMASDGSHQRVLTTNGNYVSHGLDYSPDGRHLLLGYVRDGGSFGIDLMRAGGTGKSPLANPISNGFDPVFSPDGSKIAFGLGDANYLANLYTANRDGSGVTQLTTATSDDSLRPNWGRAPEFNFLVFLNHSVIYILRSIVISGTFGDTGGDRVPGAQLTLWERPAGTEDFTQVEGKSATTSEDGTFSFGKLYPKKTTYYQVRFAGDEQRDIPAVYGTAKKVKVVK